MKSVALVLSYLVGSSRRRNLQLVGVLVGVLVLLVALYSVLFHVLMAREGQQHSWATGVYWTLTVMSTLGFGDITFQSDAGRLFSVVVLVSGALFILVLLPFVFIQFVFMPWVAWRDENRAPRRLPASTSGHLVLIGGGPVTGALIRRAEQAGIPYVLVEPDPAAALAGHDEGTKVMIGDLDSPDTYRAARVEQAALLATTHRDTTNTNIAFTVREITPDLPIVATASSPASVDILELAGCSQVLQLGDMLGQAMARRILGRGGRSRVIGDVEGLCIAEASVVHPDLIGRTLRDAGVRERANVHVVGTWERGRYLAAEPDQPLDAGTVLVLAGTAEQLASYDAAFAGPADVPGLVVVIGAGRVGRSVARVLAEAEIPHRVVEQDPHRIRDDRYVQGDAADLEVLERAGIRDAAAVLITTHDDDVNVYLTIYCRRLRPDIQVIARSNLDRNVATLHRAGADSVLSYASYGATAIWNALGIDRTVVVAEGLEVFRTPVPEGLAGKTLAGAGVRQATGATVVAVAVGEAEAVVNPALDEPLPAVGEIVVIADAEARRRFAARYPWTPPNPAGRNRRTAART